MDTNNEDNSKIDDNSKIYDNSQSDSGSHTIITNISEWSKEQEKLLAEWSEKAQCYRWLHSHAERQYRNGNFSFTIPIIIMSTLTGSANFAVDSYVPSQYHQYAQVTIGAVNILAGILSTLQNFLRYAESNEAHRNASITWSKFGRNIRIELSLSRIRRKNASDFLKIYRSEYNRLLEQSPLIPKSTLRKFKKLFKNNNIYQPDICTGIERCKIHSSENEQF